jgi:S-DNA-T family DNA segregation ATPase FtsK/SpoIIIE
LPDFAQFQEVKDIEQGDQDAFEEKCRDRGKKLEEKLLHFGVKGKVVAIRPGPVITLFEYKPEIDSKISKIISLEDDLAMALTALSIRIIAPIPGRNVVGFEISNKNRKNVYLSDVLSQEALEKFDGHLPMAFGVDITGNPVIQDLIKMPHMLVAGSTGSGKSVGLNSMLVSLLCHKHPEELKIILIDPKRLEFAPYADVPHLLFPIVTNPRKAIPVLKWVVQEMEDRYDLMAQSGVRNIVDYHRLYEEKRSSRDTELPAMPFIVLIIDELADLMMVAGKDVETYIARTAQMARAAGIHMILATQRPSVDVITGMIKVNFPARIAFRVSSKIDSRTIIDSQGAEKLLGRGDMLFLNSGSSCAQRIHGAYVSTQQITKLADYLRSQQEVEYLNINEELKKENSSENELEDELYNEIRNFVRSVDEVSISLLQRRYRIGFNRSARLIEQLERDGIVVCQQGSKMRKVIR